MPTIYCYEDCDDLNQITHDPYFNATIASSPKQEGLGSLHFNNMNQNLGSDAYVTLDVLTSGPSGKKVLGFWFYCDARNTNMHVVVSWKNPSNGHFMFISFRYGLIYEMYGGVSGTGSGSGQIQTFNLNTWYWIELIWISGTTQEIWVNGVVKKQFVGFGVTMGSTFTTECITGWAYACCSVYFDIFMVKDDREYPPSYPPEDEVVSGISMVIGEKDMTTECVLSVHYIKSHPSPDPDTFEIRLLPECGEKVNFFDTVEIKKYGVTEYYGFVEEITPEVGEDGLEYSITGRCWKLIAWKKYNERFQESREVGPVDSEGNIESGFFGEVKPEELVKFFMRCPMSEHPKGKIRHKIGWGIASDYWDCCANITAECHYPEWVALRYTGLAWRNRGDVDIIDEYVLDVKTFVSITQQWTTVGTNPWLDAEDDNYIKHDASSSGNISEHYTFESFADIGESDPISLSTVYLCCTVWGELRDVSAVLLYLWDGSSWVYVGEAGSGPFYTKKTTCLNVTETLDTITKIKNARLKIVQKNKTWTAVDHAYLKVYGASPLNPANQRVDDYFIVDMNNSYDEVTAMLIECRNNPIMYARNYKIQYAIISNCCDVAEQEEYWSDFTPAVNVVSNEVRDILHSWEPQDDVRCIRIKLTLSDCNAWEISQIYIWQADLDKRYRLMDEG